MAWRGTVPATLDGIDDAVRLQLRSLELAMRRPLYQMIGSTDSQDSVLAAWMLRVMVAVLKLATRMMGTDRGPGPRRGPADLRSHWPAPRAGHAWGD